ncbi:PREDICTED: dynamin-related protein 4C-like [Populus euphratica]|uniref:Dynamin-related protein 4C-like n=1 Tax=Populus euphratica TaxID=75702 RepID=A0AAJ6T8P6_POPEU|nr:PREDICTED: dynamin-related protein 4C-like [Populus euphratica]
MSGGKPSSKREGVQEYEVESHASVNTEVEVHVEHEAIFHDHVPIVSYYNDRITPLLDAVDRLRQLQVVKEGIQLPTIVVVGDQSSGKSSVLESLACINLPRGDGICTRVPLIMRLKHHPSLVPEIFLQFKDKTVPTDEAHVADAINLATGEIAGNGKGISNTELTLVVKKNGVPDLTLVDLPGITRVPVHGQPENIYEQIANIIMKYISPNESVILNVLSASVDFSTCESIMMSQKVDKKGERTLAVVTKVDKSPEGLLEKVTSNDVNIGLGYVCVRNRIGNESYEDARKEEAALFATHQLLSKIDESTVGIQVLAQKLVQIQANIIAKCLPDIVRKIDEKLKMSISELNGMPRRLLSVAEVMAAFTGIIGSSQESLRKILVRGEIDEYSHKNNMHGTARLVEMLNEFSTELQKCSDHTKNFMIKEIEVLEETKGIELPNILPHTAILTILKQKVEEISELPIEFVEKVWAYIGGVVISVLNHHSANYRQLQLFIVQAAHKLLDKMKDRSIDWVTEIVQMEKETDYTCNPEYMKEWNKLIAQQQVVIDNITTFGSSKVTIDGSRDVVVGDLRCHKHILLEAFDLKMRMIAYWKIVLMRLVDNMALHLQLSIRNFVNKEMEKEIINALLGTGGGVAIERMLEEPPSVASKRERLNTSIKLLRESKEVLANIRDKIEWGDH